MSDDTKKRESGWAWPINSRKAHYIDNGRSLCGKMIYLGTQIEQGNDDSIDNCAECKKRLKKQQPQVAPNQATGKD